jgi:hypothetical protein
MSLTPYSGTTAPEGRGFGVKPQLLTFTSRIWRESPERSVPLFKIEARLDPRSIDDKTLSAALQPFAAQLQSFAIYVLHTDESKRLAPWAVGRFDIDQKSAFIFLHDFLAAKNGILMLNTLQTSGASAEIMMGLVPIIVEPQRLCFAIPDYDFGVHARIR